ncbi:unnamed protein product [Ambrosiozyma monospora]|uniref:Unnamed protein product n=1 Tax=Ambrosiozyma monospora TaxID=43982 RepID=A0ACB5T3V8_AMBMO|nr:unnamed protein product [Ambrosiozyma monospora]
MNALIQDMIEMVVMAFFLMPMKAYFQDTNFVVDYPFIDEIFHYPQTQAYCAGNFTHWDPKITTPPGLYLVGYLYTKLTNLPCSLEDLRFVNFIGGLVIAFLTFTIRKKLGTWSMSSLSLYICPLITLYYSLYYTDVWSAVFVLASYTVVLTEPLQNSLVNSSLAAFVGLLSLGFRQTNIIWVAFVASAVIDLQVKKEKLYKNETVLDDFIVFLKQALKQWYLLVPFVINFGLFAAFLFYNKGITFGDKENHEVVFHPVQIFYCFTFLTVFTLPLWFSYNFCYQYIVDNFFTAKGLFFNCIWIPNMLFLIAEFTIVHPFVLADNRHYTFYIMRRIILKDDYSKYQCAIAYHFSCYVVYKLIVLNTNKSHSKSKTKTKANPPASSLVMFVAFLFAVALTLVPSPLFEPRYFIPAYLMFRVMIAPIDDPVLNVGGFLRDYNKLIRLAGELVYNFLWTQALYVVLLSIKFEWETEEQPQRIIW